MKSILMIYNDRENWPAIEYLHSCIEKVFEDYVQIDEVFLNELKENEIIKGDIYLVLFEHMIYPLKKHIENFDNVVVMTRGINKKHFNEIQKIPKGTDVLVVNDCYESTVQTTNTFYELGINHVNFIPYDKNLDVHDYYKGIEIAITPNEVQLVPNYIKKIINIGFREIGYDTINKIIQKQGFSHKLINRNFVKLMNDIVEPNANFKSSYLNSYLKSEMLNKLIYNSKEGILLTNYDYNIVYSNDKLNSILNIADDYFNKSITNYVNYEMFDMLSEIDFKDKLIKINEENYIVEKISVKLIDQVIGYNYIFRNEKDIFDQEVNLKNKLIKKRFFAKYNFDDIIYKSNSMKHTIGLSKKAALTKYTVLIQGESGTGKELIAQSIHNFSNRKCEPFVAINCASLAESLLESLLFGYESGSFTGASKNGKIGLFEQANGGTLFLDEIGDISPNFQSTLLRVIQEKQIMRIGSDKFINIDVRFIVATNKDLEEEVRKGSFRDDLYYRLNVIPIDIPPLRERKDDILLLLEYFLGENYNNLTDDEKNAIINYKWSGNVRELESVANYYKTLYELPSRIINKSNNIKQESIINCNLEVLSIINNHTDGSTGIGRTRIVYELKEKGINLSDAKVRSILDNLRKKRYIKIRKGRAGNAITPAGIDYLNKLIV